MLVIVVSAFNIFYNIWELPIQNWDEARHGVNAYEMLKNKLWFANHYGDTPDFWNLKPPLGSWLISVSYLMFGVNPFSLRFFSGVSALIVIIITIIYTKNRFGKLTSLLSGFILSTCFSFIHVHGARTGDFDAIFTLLVLLTVISMEKAKERKIYFYFAMLLFSMSFLLKSFASIIPALAIIISFFAHKIYKKLKFYDYPLLLFTGTFLIFVWGYFRYQFDGLAFFQKMISYDLIERGTKQIEGHSSSIFFYLESLVLKFLPWSLLLFISPFYKLQIEIQNSKGIFQKLKITYKNEIFKNPTILIYLLSTLIPAFLSKTKTEWYVMPVFPALSIIIAWFLSEIITQNQEGFFLALRRISITLLTIFSLIAEGLILSFTLNPYLRVVQYKPGAFQDFMSEVYLQKLLLSEDIPKNSIVGLVNTSVSQSYYFLSKAVKEYTLIEASLESISQQEREIFIISKDLAKEVKKPFKVLDSSVGWILISIPPKETKPIFKGF